MCKELAGPDICLLMPCTHQHSCSCLLISFTFKCFLVRGSLRPVLMWVPGAATGVSVDVIASIAHASQASE